MIDSPVRLTVPGNILLLGEYAVLENGGLGLGMAVNTRVRLQASPAEHLLIEAAWSGRTISWTADRRGESLLISSIVDEVSEWLGRHSAAKVQVDSSEFFSPDGRKTGLGSSAAVCVALVCALLSMAGVRAASRGAEALSLALRAHRRAQGGKGSGYDIFTSFHGGCGLFRGGIQPGWDPCTLPENPRVLLFAGAAPVSTFDAMQRYQMWKDHNPGEAQDYLRESNSAVRSFIRAGSLTSALKWFNVCKRVGIELGRTIGVPAELTVPPGLDPKWCKALGAGNELGLCILPPGVQVPAHGDLRCAVRAETGVTWGE
jgi:phosphomevalonate kinase